MGTSQEQVGQAATRQKQVGQAGTLQEQVGRAGTRQERQQAPGLGNAAALLPWTTLCLLLLQGVHRHQGAWEPTIVRVTLCQI